jgi:hypothetical protein
VLIWGDDTQVRQAIQQLKELSSRTQPDKWAKNPAYDGRKENRRELKAHEAEQATRLQLFADSKEYPFEVSIIHIFITLPSKLTPCSTPSSGQRVN